MHMFLIILAGFAAYGAPTNQDAYEAFSVRLLEDLHYSGDVLREPEVRQAPNFPSDVVLQRCVRRDQRAVALSSGEVVVYTGYECIMEIWPNAEPSYRTVGFYRHSGDRWEYYGPVQEVMIPSPSKFDSLRGKGELLTKPGSLEYDGDPMRPFNEGYNPYNDLFNQLERYSEPSY